MTKLCVHVEEYLQSVPLFVYLTSYFVCDSSAGTTGSVGGVRWLRGSDEDPREVDPWETGHVGQLPPYHARGGGVGSLPPTPRGYTGPSLAKQEPRVSWGNGPSKSLIIQPTLTQWPLIIRTRCHLQPCVSPPELIVGTMCCVVMTRLVNSIAEYIMNQLFLKIWLHIMI